MHREADTSLKVVHPWQMQRMTRPLHHLAIPGTRMRQNIQTRSRLWNSLLASGDLRFLRVKPCTSGTGLQGVYMLLQMKLECSSAVGWYLANMLNAKQSLSSLTLPALLVSNDTGSHAELLQLV